MILFFRLRHEKLEKNITVPLIHFKNIFSTIIIFSKVDPFKCFVKFRFFSKISNDCVDPIFLKVKTELLKEKTN